MFAVQGGLLVGTLLLNHDTHRHSSTSATQIRIDVTISGSVFSGDGLVYTHSTLPSAFAEENYMDYIVDATFATYTAIHEVGRCL